MKHPSMRLGKRNKKYLARMLSTPADSVQADITARKRNHLPQVKNKQKHTIRLDHLVTVSAAPFSVSTEEAKEFYQTKEWKVIRSHILSKFGLKCMCCDKAYPHIQINVDHIKPVRKYWHLRLDINNLQVLCSLCNKAKGNWDETDFRVNKKGVHKKGGERISTPPRLIHHKYQPKMYV